LQPEARTCPQTKRYRIKIFSADPAQPCRVEEVEMCIDPDEAEVRAVIEPLLNGMRLERVMVLIGGEERDMFIDHRGNLSDLPRNEVATGLYLYAYLAGHPFENPDERRCIFGSAILFTEKVWPR